MTWREAALLALLFWTPVTRAEVPIACQDSVAVPRKFAPSVDFTGSLPIPDYLEAVRGCRVPIGVPPSPIAPPPSAWLEAERSLYQSLIARSRADVLVIPVQIQGYGLDRIERALITADLARTIQERSSLVVADPFIVARALGEGARRIPIADALGLARTMGAHWLLAEYAGHDTHHAFTLTLQLMKVDGEGNPQPKPVWQKDLRSVAFTDAQPPAVTIHGMLPTALNDAPLKLAGAARTMSGAAGQRRIFALSPSALVSAKDPEVSSAGLDLLAALAPSDDERTRERAFVRVVVASWHEAPQTASSRFHAAYAWMQLEHRPAAVQALEGLATPEATALQSLLQGDLPAAESTVAQVTAPLEHLLLDIRLNDLAYRYGRGGREAPSAGPSLFGKESEDWTELIRLRASDGDPWGRLDRLAVKRALDAAFPVADLKLDRVLLGQAVITGAPADSAAIDPANVRHVRRVVASLPVPKGVALRPTQWDLLWLLEGLSESSVIRSVRVMVEKQAQFQPALDELGSLENFFGGHPVLASLRVEAAARLLRGSPQEFERTLEQQIEESSVLSGYWAHGESPSAQRALLGASNSIAPFLGDAYSFDFPRRSYWTVAALGAQTHPDLRWALALESLAFSVDDLTPLTALSPALPELGTRFTGNPRRPTTFGSEAAKKAYEADPIPGLEAALAKDPSLWLNYASLGGALIVFRNDYEGAAKLYLRFPGFAHPEQTADRVALANNAFDAAIHCTVPDGRTSRGRCSRSPDISTPDPPRVY